MKTAWVYARRRGDDAELQQQIAAMQKLAAKKGYLVIGVSADETDGFLLLRPAFRQMLRAVRTGRVDAVFTARITVISHRDRALRRFMLLLQRHHTILAAPGTQLRYELCTRGIEPDLYSRAKHRQGFLPWEREDT